MRLTQWTDYTLRVLMYCASCEGREQPVTISEVAESYSISRSHLTKIVQQLAAQNLLETSRGRGGGMRLMAVPQDINVGTIVRSSETDFTLVECFDPQTNQCRLSSYCRLQSALGEAMEAFFSVLDKLTLADLMATQPPSTGCFARTLPLHRMQGMPGLLGMPGMPGLPGNV